MSVTDTRAELVAALSTVAGVTGYEFRPSVLKTGAAWPLLDNLERGPGNAFAGTWRVMLCLGGDEKTAQAKGDELLPLIVEALEVQNVAYVSGASPGVLPTSGGDQFALEIICRSE